MVVLDKTFQLASLTCLVGMLLLYPVIELLDRWDAPGPSSDSELQIILLLTFAGLMFLLKHILTFAAFVLRGVLPNLYRPFAPTTPAPVLTLSQRITASPPIPLRI